MGERATDCTVWLWGNSEFFTSDGVLFYKNTIEYPYFYDTDIVATKLNQKYQEIINDYKTYEAVLHVKLVDC